MPRYVTRACWWCDEPATLPSMTVHEAQDEPVNTGLLDADGAPLYRLPDERQPIGFHLPKPRVRVKCATR